MEICEEEKKILKELEKELERLKKDTEESKEVFHKWDKWCLIKLKELGRATLEEWATAMNWSNPSMKTFIKNNEYKLITKNSPTGETVYRLKTLGQIELWLRYENKNRVVK